MPERNWGCISNGATFESLVTTLIAFEDPGAALFGRHGKDGGQDARSSNGRCVFQAKYRQDGSAAKAIAAAKKEAKTIAQYRTSGNAREPQWQGVTHWRLVTNATFNPTDRQIWDRDVVPLFQAQGLIAEYWERADLDAKLDKNPEIDRAYFQNTTRVFLSLPEVKERLPDQEPFLRRTTLGTFVGRTAEVQAIRSFLGTDHLFLVVHGAGGVGKTRLVIEAGESIAAEGTWQVLWANVASMEANGTWFEAIIPERPTLLLVDEPEDEQVLRVLAEQIGTKLGRTSRWKIIITARSTKDPVLKFLFGPRMRPRVDQFCIAALSREDAESMCIDLIRSGSLGSSSGEWQVEAARKIAQRFSCHPVWLTLAVHMLETTSDLAKVPENAEALAELYLSEVVERQSGYTRETVLMLLRWVSLLGSLNRENNTAVELIARQAQMSDIGAVMKAVADLVGRRALSERGARNRFVEVKPDVMRDYVLQKWLSADVGFGPDPVQPSEDAKQLANSVLQATLGGTLSAIERNILASLARTELLLRLSGHAVQLLAPFIQGMLNGIGKASASVRMALAELLVTVAIYRPEDVVNVSRALRVSPCDPERIEGPFGTLELTHDDVLLKLAWPVYHAALGAQSADVRLQILLELCELVEDECHVFARQTRQRAGDGKRAKELLGRTLEGGPHFWSDFEDAVLVVATKLLDEAAEAAPNTARLEVLKALIMPAISLKRQQTWSEGYTFYMRTIVIQPGHPAWATREKLKAKIKSLLEIDETPSVTRRMLWTLLADAHRSLNQCRMQGPSESQRAMQQEMLEDLTWAHLLLARGSRDLDEVSKARELWDWHVRFEKILELKSVSEGLEALYTSNEIAAEFKWLLDREDWKSHGLRATEKANELAAAGKDAIEAFLARAIRFFGNEQELSRVFNVAWELGARAEGAEGVRDFVTSVLSESRVGPRVEFAMAAASRWVATKRRSESSNAVLLVTDLAGICTDNDRRIRLLIHLYGQLPRSKGLGALSEEEILFIRSCEGAFLAAEQGPAFIRCVAWGLEHDWSGLKTILQRVLDAVPLEQMAAALSSLVDSLFWALPELKAEVVPPDLSVWMMNQLLRVPDLDSLGGNVEWYINEVLKRVGKPSLTWLPEAVKRRRDLEAEFGYGKVRGLSYHMRLSRFVSSLSQDGGIDPDSRTAIQKLLDLVSDTGSVGYHLHEILGDVDPHGCVVPEEVARRFAQASDLESAWRVARIGGAFPVGTQAWRIIAKSVLSRAENADRKERMSLYSALIEHGPKSWSGTPGEVPSIFKSAVESARQHLEAETDPVFRSFWKWRLSCAEADLRDEEERAKEERGE